MIIEYAKKLPVNTRDKLLRKIAKKNSYIKTLDDAFKQAIDINKETSFVEAATGKYSDQTNTRIETQTQSQPELCPNFAQSQPELCPKSARSELNFARTFPELGLKSARSQPELCPNFARSQPELCPNFARSELNFARTFPELGLKSARSQPELCPNFARSQPELCPNFARSQPEVS